MNIMKISRFSGSIDRFQAACCVDECFKRDHSKHAQPGTANDRLPDDSWITQRAWD